MNYGRFKRKRKITKSASLEFESGFLEQSQYDSRLYIYSKGSASARTFA